MPMPDATSHDGYLKYYLTSREAKIIGIGRDVRALKKSGETFPMHLSVGESLYRGRASFVGICHDLTNYHKALEKLSVAEQRYREIIQSQKQFICRLDSNLCIF
jgi:PAS domain S-box-containing protein